MRKSSSGYFGVHRTPSNGFVAEVVVNHERHRLGTFHCAIEAAKAVDAKSIELLGTRTRHLNFPAMPECPEGARLIPLTKQKWAIVDAEDYDTLSADTWAVGSHGYAARTHGETMHSILLPVPQGFYVDHINRDRLDNRRANLRQAHPSLSAGNTRKKGRRNRYKGVTPKKNGRWVAQIGTDYKTVYLGMFPDEVSAARAYDAAARKVFGEFANLNFPSEAAA